MFIYEGPVAKQTAVQYTQRVQNLRLCSVDQQKAFHITYFLKIQMVKKLIGLISDDFFIYIRHFKEAPNLFHRRLLIPSQN